MTWKGIAPIVHCVETIYDKGIKVLPTELEQYHPFWQRSEALPHTPSFPRIAEWLLPVTRLKMFSIPAGLVK